MLFSLFSSVILEDSKGDNLDRLYLQCYRQVSIQPFKDESENQNERDICSEIIIHRYIHRSLVIHLIGEMILSYDQLPGYLSRARLMPHI